MAKILHQLAQNRDREIIYSSFARFRLFTAASSRMRPTPGRPFLENVKAQVSGMQLQQFQRPKNGQIIQIHLKHEIKHK